MSVFWHLHNLLHLVDPVRVEDVAVLHELVGVVQLRIHLGKEIYKGESKVD